MCSNEGDVHSIVRMCSKYGDRCKLTPTQRNSVNMLNYMSALIQEINESIGKNQKNKKLLKKRRDPETGIAAG